VANSCFSAIRYNAELGFLYHVWHAQAVQYFTFPISSFANATQWLRWWLAVSSEESADRHVLDLLIRSPEKISLLSWPACVCKYALFWEAEPGRNRQRSV
jgi:hypothetical protein